MFTIATVDPVTGKRYDDGTSAALSSLQQPAVLSLVGLFTLGFWTLL